MNDIVIYAPRDSIIRESLIEFVESIGFEPHSTRSSDWFVEDSAQYLKLYNINACQPIMCYNGLTNKNSSRGCIAYTLTKEIQVEDNGQIKTAFMLGLNVFDCFDFLERIPDE